MHRARLPGRLGLGRIPAQRRGRRASAARRACARRTSCRSRSSRRRPRPRSGTTRTSPAPSSPSARRAELARQLEERSLALYRAGAQSGRARGLILADTKFEFGWIDGEVALIDELLTPDSSRFWDAALYAPGQPPPSFDKQYVRDFVAGSGWDKEPPGAAAARRSDRGNARSLCHRLRAPQRPALGRRGAIGLMRWLAEVQVTAPARDRRPGGRHDRRRAPLARLRLGDPGAGRQAPSDQFEAPDATQPRRRSPRCAADCSPTR